MEAERFEGPDDIQRKRKRVWIFDAITHKRDRAEKPIGGGELGAGLAGAHVPEM